MQQPEGEFAFRRAAEFVVSMSVDELMGKVVAAAGGEAALRKHKTMVSMFDMTSRIRASPARGRSASARRTRRR